MNPERVKDLFKRLYQNLVPRDVRHKLGEYFTPDWLAELLLNEIKYDGHPEKSVLDPACGSGTFLVLSIKRVKDYSEEHFLDKRIILKRIISKIKGIDLNPLAVLAAKANYLIALSDMLRYRPKEGIEIPIYLADSIFVGRKVAGQSEFAPQLKLVEMEKIQEWEAYVTTNEGQFWMPMEVIDSGELFNVLYVISECIKSEYSSNEFLKRLKKDYKFRPFAYEALQRLYDKIIKLEKLNKDKIWTTLLKNRFAPLFIGKFDLVIGNPPWINWENLPEFHREETKPLWDYYGLLEKTKGMGLGKVKRDLAMLFVARCFDRYAQDKGVLSFLVPFTLFKTQAGAGFRKFLSKGFTRKGFTYKLGANKDVPIETIKVHDLVELYPFEGAVNRTAMVTIKNGKTNFPIPCTMWSNPRRESITMEEELENVKKRTKQNEMILTPIIEGDGMTPWMIISTNAYKAVRNIIGESEYDGHAGVYTGMNGIYWLEILRKEQNGLLVKNTQLAGQKKKVKEVTEIVELDLTYPLIRGEDVKKWYGEPKRYILVPHEAATGKPIDESKLKINYPNTYNKYLFPFRKELIGRSIHKLWGKNSPFYALYDIGTYSFAPYKVMWKEISGKISGKGQLIVAVIEPIEDKYLSRKLVIPDHKLMFVPFFSKHEAYFVAGVLNSSVVQMTVMSYTIETNISTRVLEHIKVPEFNGTDSLHLGISKLSQDAHKLAKENRTDELKEIEQQVDEKVAELYQITEDELVEIKKCLTLLKEGEIEAEEEVEEELIIEESKDMEIRISPLLIDENTKKEIIVEVCNNFDNTVRNITIEISLSNKRIGGKLVEKINSRDKASINFDSPSLTSGEYPLRVNLICSINNEKLTMEFDKRLFVQKGTVTSKVETPWDEDV